jgi:hypothetical protein
VTYDTSRQAKYPYFDDNRNKAFREASMIGFEILGLAFLGLSFTALQFAWLVASA